MKFCGALLAVPTIVFIVIATGCNGKPDGNPPPEPPTDGNLPTGPPPEGNPPSGPPPDGNPPSGPPPDGNPPSGPPPPPPTNSSS